MSTPDLAYIMFSIMTLALMACVIYISHLQHQNAELYSTLMEQDALLDVYVEHVRELSILLEAASESVKECRAALRDIDSMLQTDPIQFLFTNEEIHHG